MSNPLFQPIHGISLEDFAAISAKIAQGISVDEILKALGVEQAIFEEASVLWSSRMQQDSTFEVTMAFGQYFANPQSHPVLCKLQPTINKSNIQYLEKFTTDRHFYEELCAARQAAYNYGLDGAQWIQENYGINLGDFQSISMNWVALINQQDTDMTQHFLVYREQKEQEYSQKFAHEQGGNLADDIEF